MKTSRLISVKFFLLAILFVRPLAAADLPWPNRNGPFQNGCAAERDARGVPMEWDESSGKNIAWKIDLEGLGHSTPVIGHGKLWFTAATPNGKQQFIYAICARTGRVRCDLGARQAARRARKSRRLHAGASRGQAHV